MGTHGDFQACLPYYKAVKNSLLAMVNIPILQLATQQQRTSTQEVVLAIEHIAEGSSAVEDRT